MAYLVNFTFRAERDLNQIYEYISVERSDAARRWYQGLKARILSLEVHPNRCPIRAKRRLRTLLYGRRPNIYLVIYRVLEKRKLVEVLHIRHGLDVSQTSSI